MGNIYLAPKKPERGGGRSTGSVTVRRMKAKGVAVRTISHFIVVIEDHN